MRRRRRMALRAASAVALVTALAAPAPAAAGERLAVPPPGRTLLGFYSWDPAAFTAIAGREHAVRWRTVDWDPRREAGKTWQVAVRAAEAGNWVLQASWSTERYDETTGGPVEAISPGRVAAGAGDGAILAAATALRRAKVPTILRFEPEMNGYWHSYCAYGAGGRARDAEHGTAAFVAAWRRVRTIFRGGTRRAVDEALRRLGQPPLTVRTRGAVGAPAVAFAFVPNVSANPAVGANTHTARAYYPGDRYVDWVGVDLYDNSPDAAEWPFDRRVLAGQYAAHPSKPFGLFEWGLTSGDDDARFVDAVFGWVRKHPRVALMDWYDSARSRLADNPASGAAYARGIASPRFLSQWR